MTTVTAPRSIEAADLRRALGHYPTGVVIVTACDADGAPVGMVIGSFTSVSLDPPLVGYLPTRTSRTFARLRQAESFCVNVLGHEHEALCRTLSSSGGMDAVAWHRSELGAPVLDDAVAWFECTYDSIVEAGDHYLVLGRVVDYGTPAPRSPLIFFQGGMGRFAAPSVVMPEEAGLIEAVHLGTAARTELESLARELQGECSVMVPVGDELVLVATANSAPSTEGEYLGTRVPLTAPMAEGFAAFTGPEGIAAWLARAGDLDEATVARYHRRLAEIRERGWAMSLAGPPEERVLYADFKRRSRAELTPTEERELLAKISRLQRYYTSIDSVGDGPVDIHSIAAPVLDDDGRPVMVLRLSQVGTIDRPTARWFGERLAAGARTIQRSLRRGEHTS